ncbi:MAG: thiamine phosphate synthase [Actinomycetes bacterium]
MAARLYLVLGLDPRLEAVVSAALAGGVDVVQLREKHASDGDILAAADRVRSLCEQTGALFVLNDRPDLALRAGADSVHLGQDDMPLEEARAIVGDDVLIGLSTHTAAQIDAADGADYIGVGPVWGSPTKPGWPPTGTELVRAAALRVRMPWFAIGGIDETNVVETVAAGASRIAVIRAIVDADDPAGAAARLRAALGQDM